MKNVIQGKGSHQKKATHKLHQ